MSEIPTVKIGRSGFVRFEFEVPGENGHLEMKAFTDDVADLALRIEAIQEEAQNEVAGVMQIRNMVAEMLEVSPGDVALKMVRDFVSLIYAEIGSWEKKTAPGREPTRPSETTELSCQPLPPDGDDLGCFERTSLLPLTDPDASNGPPGASVLPGKISLRSWPSSVSTGSPTPPPE